MRFNLSDNPIARALGRLCDLVILNLLFIVCSLPIITIGASATAMYTVMLKLVKDEEGYILKGFLAAFVQNFKKGTIAWLILLIVNALVYFNIYLSSMMDIPTMSTVFMVIFMVFAVVILCGSLYVFPLIARYENPLKNTFKNAFLLSIGRLPFTALLVLIHAVPVVIPLLHTYLLAYGVLFWFLVGFSAVSWMSSKILRKVFEIFETTETTNKV